VEREALGPATFRDDSWMICHARYSRRSWPPRHAESPRRPSRQGPWRVHPIRGFHGYGQLCNEDTGHDGTSPRLGDRRSHSESVWCRLSLHVGSRGQHPGCNPRPVDRVPVRLRLGQKPLGSETRAALVGGDGPIACSRVHGPNPRPIITVIGRRFRDGNRNAGDDPANARAPSQTGMDLNPQRAGSPRPSQGCHRRRGAESVLRPERPERA